MAKSKDDKEGQEELSVAIHTPDGTRAESRVRSVVAPGDEGDMTVMPGHCGLVSPLRAGILELHHTDSVEYYSITGGALSVEGDSVSISAFAAENAEEIDVERAERARERAKAILASESEDRIIEEARAALYRALIRLEAHDLARRG